jgi:hypothetical protein
MSEFTNSSKPLKLVNVIDPRLECMSYAQNEKEWAIFKGFEGQNFIQQQANSYSNSSIVWNFNSQSENIVIDRRIYAKVQFQMTFVGKAPVGTPLLNTESDAPRAFPLASVCQDVSVRINGRNIESRYKDSLTAFLRYNMDNDCLEHDLSQTPNAPDRYQRYIDGVGSIRNPLSDYANSGEMTGRGAFQMDSVVNPVGLGNGAGDASITAIVKFTVVEPLLLSPLLYKSEHLESGLIGVNNLGVSLNFASGQLSRVWSHAQNVGVNISSATCNIGSGSTEPPQLLVNYLSPPLIDMGKIPRSVNYQYYRTSVHSNDYNVSVLPNGKRQLQSNSIQLSTVPRSIYIYANRPENDRTFETTDTFFRINGISLNYLNVSGQFGSMTVNELYQMSRKNGCNLSFNEWSGKTGSLDGTSDGLVGSVLKIDISDLHVNSSVASGMALNSQLSYTIDIENVNQVDTLGVQITTILVYDGLMTIQNGTMETTDNVINSEQVLKTRESGVFVDFKSASSIYGGSLFSKLGHFSSMGKKGLDLVCDAKKMLGMGMAHEKEEKHGGVMAGQMMSRNQLKNRMYNS